MSAAMPRILLTAALALVLSGDADLMEIVALSLRVSLVATGLATAAIDGFPKG